MLKLTTPNNKSVIAKIKQNFIAQVTSQSRLLFFHHFR
jgi:hypothetical protein